MLEVVPQHTIRSTDLMDDMRLFVSLVNWHRTLRLEHSVQLAESEASH